MLCGLCGASCEKKRATSDAVDTNPAAGAMASHGLSPGTISRWPNGNSLLWHTAKGARRGRWGMSGAVSSRLAAAITWRCIQVA